MADSYASEISESKINRIQLQRKDIESKLEIELDQAMLNLSQQKQQTLISEKQLSLAKENYRINSAKFKEGLITQLEFLNAFTLQKDAATNYEKDRIEYIRQTYNLKKVTGELLPIFKG